LLLRARNTPTRDYIDAPLHFLRFYFEKLPDVAGPVLHFSITISFVLDGLDEPPCFSLYIYSFPSLARSYSLGLLHGALVRRNKGKGKALTALETLLMTMALIVLSLWDNTLDTYVPCTVNLSLTYLPRYSFLLLFQLVRPSFFSLLIGDMYDTRAWQFIRQSCLLNESCVLFLPSTLLVFLLIWVFRLLFS
jgi:hypothetical protein